MRVKNETVDFMFSARAELVLQLEITGLGDPADGDYMKWSPVK